MFKHTRDLHFLLQDIRGSELSSMSPSHRTTSTWILHFGMLHGYKIPHHHMTWGLTCSLLYLFFFFLQHSLSQLHAIMSEPGCQNCPMRGNTCLKLSFLQMHFKSYKPAVSLNLDLWKTSDAHVNTHPSCPVYLLRYRQHQSYIKLCTGK